MKKYLAGPLVGLLLVFSTLSPAIASRQYGRLNPCNTQIITEDANGNVIVSHGRSRRRGRRGRTVISTHGGTVVATGRTVISNGESSHPSQITRIQRTCLVRTRRIRAETAECGVNQYSQPRVGEFRRSEWRRNNRVVYSETELIRCF